MSTDIHFDAKSHTYTTPKGVVLPSVTTVIAPLIDYSMVPQELLALAAERGDAVHKATWLDDQNDLDESSVDDVVFPYLYAWRKFRRDKHEWSVFDGERLVHSKEYRYAGTLDRLFQMHPKFRDLAVTEIKTTSQIMPATGVQLAGYQMALPPEIKQRVTKRFVVQLRADGEYRLEEFKDASDFATFHSLLSITNWKNRHAA